MLFQTFPVYLAGCFITFQALHKWQTLHCFSSLLPMFISSQGQNEFANCFLPPLCSQRHNLRVSYINLIRSSLQPWKAPRYILLCLLPSQIFFRLWKAFRNFLLYQENLELLTEVWVFPYWNKTKRNSYLSGLSWGRTTSHRLITPWIGNYMNFWVHI